MRIAGAIVVAAIWLVLVGVLWFGPRRDISDAERRKLAQMPKLTSQSFMDRSFMEKFEEFTLDQFPGRDSFRQIKSVFHYYVMRQMDNNNIYVQDGYAAKMEYPLNMASADMATTQLKKIYNMYLKKTDANIYVAIVPDKGYYLGEQNGYLALDYKGLYEGVYAQMPWATPIDLTDCLSAEDYYRTDTHWRQEKLFPVAQKISQAMGVEAPKTEDFTPVKVERPFYGVYYGQAALPMDADDMYTLKNDILDSCTTSVPLAWDNEKNEMVYKKLYDGVYDMSRMEGKDLYEIYLSGMQSVLRIDNPKATTDKELIIFRDSFGSSLSPLLLQGYKSILIIDVRYISSSMLKPYLNHVTNQDVLFTYSTLVLNSTGGSLMP